MLNQEGGIPKKILPHVHHLQDNIHQSYLMALRDKKGILFILRAVMQSYPSALCVHSRLTNVLLRFKLDNKFQKGGGTESYVHEQTLENQSRQLPEPALSSRSQQGWSHNVEPERDLREYLVIQHGFSRRTNENPGMGKMFL